MENKQSCVFFNITGQLVTRSVSPRQRGTLLSTQVCDQRPAVCCQPRSARSHYIITVPTRPSGHGEPFSPEAEAPPRAPRTHRVWGGDVRPRRSTEVGVFSGRLPAVFTLSNLDACFVVFSTLPCCESSTSGIWRIAWAASQTSSRTSNQSDAEDFLSK